MHFISFTSQFVYSVLTFRLCVQKVDLRDSLSNTRHKLEFDIEIPDSTISRDRNPDKVVLRERIFQLRAEGSSFREIAREVGLHWTRIQQIVNGK